MTPSPDPRQPALAGVTKSTTPAKQERKTKPRILSGAAVQETTVILNGKPRRGRLAVCSDGRVNFSLWFHKLQVTDTTNDNGERLFTSDNDTLWIKEVVYQKLMELSAAFWGVSQ